MKLITWINEMNKYNLGLDYYTCELKTLAWMWCAALDVEFHLCMAWNCWERFEWSPIRSHWIL